MRPEVKKVIQEDIITLSELAESLDANPALIYRFVVNDKVCEHLRIGRSHIVIDREDIDLVRDRVARSNNYKANRKPADAAA